ncbi:MAG TPA: thiol:disulfide interchange protein DsbA/DsbL [Woeseiaceae bacterium]|nr:thiol:disulfide interchange protein DsbA/DsbL [Woeseiaceae bacterium]
MQRLLAASFILMLALAGCGEPEPPAPVAEPESVAEEAAPEAPAAPEEDATADETPTQVLEESATMPEEPPGNEPIKLARANVGEPQREWRFREGVHFERLVPTQPTIGGPDKIEVAEVFWYGCPHCRDFEPIINAWAERAPANVRFVRIPAAWNPLMKLHAQLYYTEQELVAKGAIANPESFRAAVFREYHERRNRLTSVDSIRSFFERTAGITAEQFDAAWNSYGVKRQLDIALDLTSASDGVECDGGRYCITGVPAMVVNGKYKTGPTREIDLNGMLAVVDELIEREALR